MSMLEQHNNPMLASAPARQALPSPREEPGTAGHAANGEQKDEERKGKDKNKAKKPKVHVKVRSSLSKSFSSDVAC